MEIFPYSPTILNLFILLNTKEDILKNDGRHLMYPIDFNSRENNTMEVNGVHQLSGYRHFSKSSFVFSRRKKFIEVSNNLRVSK